MRTFIFAAIFAFVCTAAVNFFERVVFWNKTCQACERGGNCFHDRNWKEHCPALRGETR